MSAQNRTQRPGSLGVPSLQLLETVPLLYACSEDFLSSGVQKQSRAIYL